MVVFISAANWTSCSTVQRGGAKICFDRNLMLCWENYAKTFVAGEGWKVFRLILKPTWYHCNIIPSYNGGWNLGIACEFLSFLIFLSLKTTNIKKQKCQPLSIMTFVFIWKSTCTCMHIARTKLFIFSHKKYISIYF